MKKLYTFTLCFALMCLFVSPVLAVDAESIRVNDVDYYAYFDEFYSEYQVAKQSMNSEDMMTAYLDYLVTQGVIDNTDEAREIAENSIKQDLRDDIHSAMLVAGAYGKWPMASGFLSHSLNDAPPDLTYQSGSTYSNKVLNTIEMQGIISNVYRALSSTTGSYYTTSGSDKFESHGTTDSQDAFLAIHYFNYSVSAIKNSATGKWSIRITLTDVYDYEIHSGYGNPWDTINNTAAVAQSMGAIVPYNITINIQITY